MNMPLLLNLFAAPFELDRPRRSSCTGEAMTGAATHRQQMPDEFSPRRIRRRLLEFAAVRILIAILVFVGPALGSLRSHLRHASAGWLSGRVGTRPRGGES
jgi:hypothetical protein